MAYDWSDVGTQSKDQLKIALVLCSLSKRDKVGKNNEVQSEDTTTTNALNRSSCKHAGNIVAGTADDGTDCEAHNGTEIHRSSAENV